MLLNPMDYLDSDYDSVPEGQFSPKWYVVRVVGNNSREVIAAFDEDHGEYAALFVQSDSSLYLIAV